MEAIREALRQRVFKCRKWRECVLWRLNLGYVRTTGGKVFKLWIGVGRSAKFVERRPFRNF